jgi:T5SS/PEP-CTERM-associated repeat protein
LLLFCVALIAPTIGRGQLVVDGSTNVLDGTVTNVTGDITIGANLPYSLLVLTNGAAVAANGTANAFVGLSSKSNTLVLDGATLANRVGYIGYNTRDNCVVVSGPTAAWTNISNLFIGYESLAFHNQLVISNGARVFASTCYVGYLSTLPNGSTGSNVVAVTGGALLQSPLSLGSGGQLFITNGGTVTSPSASVYDGLFHSGGNRILVDGTDSVWRVSENLSIGTSWPAERMEVTVTNGGSLFANTFFAGGQDMTIRVVSGGNLFATNYLMEDAGCNIILDGGLINVGSLDRGDNGPLAMTFNRGTLQVRDIYDNLGNSGLDRPVVIGNSNAQATLEMLSPPSTSHLKRGMVISSNALMKGVCAILGKVTVLPGGTLSPGSSIGQMNIQGLVLTAGSTNVMELNADTGACDSIVAQTNITYGGALQLSNLSGTLTNGSSFQLYSSTNYNGAFDTITPLSPGPGLTWNTNRLTVDGVLRVMNLHALPPTITAGQVSAGNLTLQASGGVPYDPCYVLTCTNLSPPVNWQHVGTNTFDTNGNATISLPASLSQPAQFYRLQVD